jgi:hypothetical protein
MACSEDVKRVFNEHQRFEIGIESGSLGTCRVGGAPS